MTQSAIAPVLFHLAFPVGNIQDTKAYYVEGLGCEPGRQNDHCLIMKLYGHQLVAHVTQDPLVPQKSIYPRHFGLVFLAETDWQNLCDRIEEKQISFYQRPRIRFEGSPLEHKTFFLEDPFHNLIELKFYRHIEAIFGAQDHQNIGDLPLAIAPST